MRRTIAVAAVAAGLGVAGCSDEQASVVDRAFSQDVKSGVLAMDVHFAGGGERGGIRLAGPFSGGDDAHLGRFDWTATIDMPGEKPLRGELVCDGSDVFVRYGGQLYHVGRERIARFERRSAQQAARGPKVDDLGDLERLGLDVQSWFPQSAGPQDATFGGEPTTRVTGTLDVSAALRDFVKLLRNPDIRAQLGAGAGGAGTGAGGAPRLSPAQIAQVDKAISDPRFEIQVGREDGKLRRLDGGLSFRGGGRMTFDVQLSRVDQPVQIDAPSGGQPIRRLLKRLRSRGQAGHVATGAARGAARGG